MGCLCSSDVKEQNNGTKEYIQAKSDQDKIIQVNSEVIIPKLEGSPDNYMIIKSLGSGFFGRVYLVQHKTLKSLRAMKKITPRVGNKASKAEAEGFKQEFEVLKKVSHPNILRIYESYSYRDSFYLITEYCKGGELYDKINSGMTEEQVAVISYQLLYAVFHLHINKIIHRDIKLDNILIDSINKSGHYLIKIIDFGSSTKQVVQKQESLIVGTSYYIAPEVLRESYDEKCDLWSVGVITYMLLTGRPPFDGKSETEIFTTIVTGKFSYEKPDQIKASDEAKILLKALFEVDPKKRPSAFEALNSNWFKKMRVKEILADVDPSLVRKLVMNIKNFKVLTRIQLAVIAFIVHNVEPNEEIKAAQKLFLLFDDNLEGRITKSELRDGLNRFLPSEESLQSSEEIFQALDANNSGNLEFEEFIRGCIDCKSLFSDEILQYAFEFFDKDSSGKISLLNLIEAFDVKDNACSKEVLKDMIRVHDLAGDGEICLNEFKLMMNKL